MRAIGRFFARILFWSYDRGTVPYDLLVIAIVAFVFLSPRRWFHDQPDIGPLPQQARVSCLKDQPQDQELLCRVDAHLLFPPQRSPELQEKAHEVLRNNAAELKGKTFQIVQIQPVVGEDGAVMYYDVSVRP
jgi:hypothetical protein